MRWRHDLSTVPPPIAVDEYPVGYSLAGCSPTEPAFASPTSYSMPHQRAHGRLVSRRRRDQNWTRNTSRLSVTFSDEATRPVLLIVARQVRIVD